MRLGMFLCLIFPSALTAQQRPIPTKVAESGAWRVEVRKAVVSPPGNHVTRWAQELWRFAPGAEEGELLHRQVSSGRPQLFLRDDGFCVLQPVGGPALLCFPGGPKLPYPFESREDCNDWDRIGLQVEHGSGVHFFGDLCVVARLANARMQLACFEANVEKRTVTPVRTLVDVCGEGANAQRIARAAVPDRLMLRLGDVLFWVNRGDSNSIHPLENPWSVRQLRAFDLVKGELIDPESLTPQWLGPHHKEVYEFIKNESHNVLAEFEMWAIPRFGEGGWTQYTDRLVELFASLEHPARKLVIDGEEVESLREVRRVYLEALTKLNDR